ncbi:MAG: TIGR04255 family protein [Candidatus Omnitrophica bacterium]|nr:TIGR04255 family protein [Candidatus Omnitrophota bacterium]
MKRDLKVDVLQSDTYTIKPMIMRPHKFFPNAPIKEALVDIRVNLPSETNLETLAKFQDHIKNNFPIKEERLSFNGGVQIKPGSAPEIVGPTGGVDGYLFRTNDGKKIVQARMDGFTFNQLKPYDRWETFSAEAKSLWEIYVKVAKPNNVTRLALRYINQIEIPLPIKQFKEFILTVPDLAEGIPDGIEKFFMQLIVPDDDRKNTAIITETMESIEKGFLPFIFDIDAYREISLDPNSPEIWDVLDSLRNFKNRIFLNSITPKCEEIFK